MDTKERYGLIAGNGRFPFLVLQSARRQEIDVVVAAIKEETFPEIESCGYPVHWLGLGELGKLLKLFQKSGVQKAIMAGQVKHVQIFGSAFPDLTMIRMLAGLKHKNTDSLIGGVAKVLEESGIALVDSSVLLKPHLAAPGTLTRRGLSSSEQSDVDFGRPIAQKIAAMDIGQTIVVRERAVLAVEAMEGTDAVIQRAGELGNKKDLTVIKVSKPKQDMRFDIPVIGMATVNNMIACGATALVIDAQRTLIFDKEEVLETANKNGIAIVALPPLTDD
ncbi:MAG TPA: UDP-2,3-diacylglucosamine diphosphatase LpxI [Acidobacteriota bacterium]|nr:UDP-2,3-diacylglucosamine diphosphatase LpxI [Acidobacteriota bacterium]